jgi:WD40 repeat protein
VDYGFVPPALRAALALVFVAGVAFVLAQPALDSDDATQATSSPAPTREPSPEPSQAPTPEAEPSATPQAPLTELVDLYPRHCLHPAPAVDGGGAVAALSGDRAEISDLDGRAIDHLQAEGPIQWSPSGRYLASGGESVHDFQGDFSGPLLGLGLSRWTWSPTSDCVLGIVRDGSGKFSGQLFGGPPGKAGALLVDRPAADFSLSPDGRSLAFVLRDDRNIYVADLKSGLVGVMTQKNGSNPIELLPWSSDSEFVIFNDTGSNVIGDSGGSGSTAKVQDVEVCGSRTILSYARFGLEELFGALPRKLRSPPVSSPACSPAGTFIAAIKDEVLTLLDSQGRPVRRLSPDDGLTDAAPDWGPSGTGVLFVRADNDEVAGLWYIEPGSPAAAPLGLDVDGDAGTFDWSATPPVGDPLS